MLANSYPPVLGGLQSVAHNLARRLTLRGHRVQVVTKRYPLTLPGYEERQGVPVHRWVCLTTDHDSALRGRTDLFLAGLVLSPIFWIRLNRLAAAFQPDVLNVHFPEAFIPYVLRLHRRTGQRLVVSLHGHDVERWTGVERASKPNAFALWKQLLQAADAVTVVSPYLLERAASLEPAIAPKAFVIPNGVDPSRFRVGARSPFPWPYVLAFGRLAEAKGFDQLIDAFYIVVRQHPSAHLVLAGAGEQQEALRAQVRRLGLEGAIVFYGRASEEEIAQLLTGSSFVVIPSRSESFGIAALETLAAKKPLICTRVGGLIQSIAEVAGPLTLSEGGRADWATVGAPGRDSAGVDRWPPLRFVEGRAEDLAGAVCDWLVMEGQGRLSPSVADVQFPERLIWERVVDRYEEVFLGTA